MKTSSIVYCFIFEIIFVLASAVLNVNGYLVLLLNIWAIIFIHYCTNLRENIAVVCFLISFFIFLLGREVMFSYFGLQRYYLYLGKENNFTFVCLSVALISLVIGIELASGKIKFSLGNIPIFDDNEGHIYKPGTVRICRNVFLFCLFFSIIGTVIQSLYVRTIGYAEAYVAESGAGLPPAISYISAFTNIAFAFYLASRPEKTEAQKVFVLYEAYAFLTLLTGARFPFIAINMVIIIYSFVRNRTEEGWVKKSDFILVAITIPVLFVAMVIIDSVRSGGQVQFSGIFNMIGQFFDSQGGSINMVKRVRYYENELSDMSWVSLSTLRSNLFENIIARRFFGAISYTGNSIEHAMNGSSLAHRLSYLTYGSYYLSGHGVGSCYIAELYHDMNFFGVITGNLLYGFLLKKLSIFKFGAFFKDALVLSFIYSLMHSPRAEFDEFIGSVFNLYSILGIFIVLMLIRVLVGAPYLDSSQSKSKVE